MKLKDRRAISFKQGYEGMKQREKTMPPQAFPQLTEALESLVLLYDATATLPKPSAIARSWPPQSKCERGRSEGVRSLLLKRAGL